MLKHLLHNVTEDQNMKQRMFITCCSEYKAELQRLYNHMQRSIQPLQKQSPLIYCSVILNKLGVTQPVNLLTPNVNYIGHTASLTSKVAFYIFIQQI